MAVRKERDGKRRKGGEGVAGQVRMEELLAKAVIINGRKECYCRFCSEQGRSAEGARQTFRQFCKASASGQFQPRRVGEVRARPHQASAKTKCLCTKTTGQKRQNCWSCVKKTRGSRKKEGHRRCSLKTLVQKAREKNECG